MAAAPETWYAHDGDASLAYQALAGAGEVLVSGVIPPLVLGSRLTFTDRGEHELKGVPGSWRVLAVDL